MHPKSQTKGYRDVLLRVQAQTAPGESVCVCGNVPELGDWHVANCVVLTQDDPDSDRWSTLIRLPSDETIEFRYLICIILESHPIPLNGTSGLHNFTPDGSLFGFTKESNREVVVRRWETHGNPRIILATTNGFTEPSQVHTFGYYDGHEKIEPGWLTQESVVQFKFYNNPVTLWKQSRREKPFSMRISPIDLSRRISEVSIQSIDDSEQESNSIFEMKADNTWPVIESAVMNDTEFHFTKQEQFGRIYSPDDFVIFQAQMLQPNTIAYMVDFYSYEVPVKSDENKMEETSSNVIDGISKLGGLIPTHMGFCYILPSNLRDTTGTCTMPITGKRQQPIGQLTIEYLIVRPMKDYLSNCRRSYTRSWKAVKKGLDVGHRGAGNRRRTDKVENVLENTVASFNYAARHGADMVELDVQLSKDKVPVIYHDYYICIAMKKKKQADEERMQLAVKDLTARQLQKLKLSPTDAEKHQYDFCEDDVEENQPFPTLQHVLEAVDPRVGFNVEIKCPMQYRDGTWEMDHQFDLNTYVDIILKTILEHSGNRYIIISCFHPDICAMIGLKQNTYPLLFLTQGQTDRYPPYLDTRTSTVPMAVYFAMSGGFLGISVHTEELLRDRSLINFVKSRNLILFCWGEDLTGSEIVHNLKKDGVDGVIYDKIDEFSTAKENIFLVESNTRMAVLEAAGHSNESMVSWSSSVSNNSA